MDLGIAAGPVTDLVKAAAVPAAHRLAHMIRFRKEVDKLKKKVDADLQPRIADLKTRIGVAEDNEEEIYQTVKAWLEKAEATQAKTSKLNDDVLQINSCFMGWFFQRYRLGKEAHEEILIVGEILKDGENILNREISCRKPYQAIPVQDFEIFESRRSSEHEILQALKDNHMVGVWGMGGIGKTLLMRHILERARKENLFDGVVMAVVSQPPNMNEIQTRIAEQLGLKFHGESKETRATELFLRLSRGNNLVLLDDVWKKLDLHELGIPHGDTSKCCKLVLTTRESVVCDQMNVEPKAKIEVKVLSEQESKALFQRNTGVNVNPDVSEEMVNKVVGECKGLPLAIVTLGQCLRNKKFIRWVNAAEQLERSRLAEMSPVVTCIKYSYDNLETNEEKLCFLLFCLYPEDAMIEVVDLLPYIIGEEIFRDAESLNDSRRRLDVLVDKLKSSCLLLEGRYTGWYNGDVMVHDIEDKYTGSVTVHDIVRDVGISIASEESNGFMIKSGMPITEWPITKSTRACLRMSLMNNVISNLEGAPKCPQLSLLSLIDNRYLTHISDGFFGGMERLVTLDLSGTKIPSLPQSISCLTNHLRTLLLNNNNFLKDIFGIGSLRQLEILNLSKCDLKRLPEEMKNLTKLKLMNLSSNKNLKVIPPYVISSLTLLEEFYMFDSFSHWEIEGEANRDNASFSELLSLPSLSTLDLGTNQDSLVHMDYSFQLKKLSKFNINLCHQWFHKSNYSKTMCIKVNDHKPIIQWVKALWEVSDKLTLLNSGTMEGVFIDDDASLRKLQALEVLVCDLVNLPSELLGSLQNLKSIKIFNCKYLKAITSEGDVRRLKVMCDNLESINIGRCDNVEVLFDFKGLREEGHINILSKLRKIDLYGLQCLEKIWEGSISFESIQNLEEVSLKFCENLSYLFPISIAKNLQQLEILSINDCPKMQIFGWEEEEVNEISSSPEPSRITAVLPRLKTLYIQNIKQSNLSISVPCLETLTIYCCNLLEEVFKDEDSPNMFSRLTLILFSSLPKLIAIWKGSMPLRSFQNLKRVEINNCESLTYIFPSLGSDEEDKGEREAEEKMNEIVSSNCCMIDNFWDRRNPRSQVPSAIEDGEPPIIMVELPQLKTLKLISLIKLSGFCQQSSIIFFFPSLEVLHIQKCRNLKRLPFNPHSTPELKEFKANNDWFERLEWGDQNTKAQMQSLLQVFEGKHGWVCDNCRENIDRITTIHCEECPDFDLCVECFSIGAEVMPHKSNHPYRVLNPRCYPLKSPDWSANEEILLLEGIKMHGVSNWVEVAKHVGTKSLVQCIDHYPKATLKMGQSVDPFLLDRKKKKKKERERILMTTLMLTKKNKLRALV